MMKMLLSVSSFCRTGRSRSRSCIAPPPNNIVSFLLVIILCWCNSRSEGVVTLPEGESVPAVIVFGDSIVDPGNNNNRATISKCNYPPYGRDFIGGKPTGRFSNGRIPSDFIAEELGIKMLLPAYLDPALQPDDFLTGVSFASGASGYDPLTSTVGSAYSLSDQLEFFKEYIGKLEGMVGEESSSTIVSKSIVFVVQGSNDIANTYFILRRGDHDFSSYADHLVTYASSFFLQLYDLGVRKVAVVSTPPLGCLPSQRTIAGGKQRECVEEYNEASELFNAKLAAELDTLNANFALGRFVYVDIYNPLLDLIQNPQKSGFEVVNKGCCGTGLIEVTLLCNKYNPFTCDDAKKYVFWDSFHPTERAYKILISGVIQRYVDKFF